MVRLFTLALSLFRSLYRSLSRSLLLPVLATLLAAQYTQAQDLPQDLPQDPGYTLSAGDSIRVHVYGEPDLTFESLLIGSNGRISYPFLGELKVTDKSAAQLQQMLTNGLKPDYLIDPRISVSIVKYRPFFVNGEVKRPGGVDFQPGLTLRKAVSLAGGFTERANKKQILVIADSDANKKEQTVSLDYKVQPGDIFTVQDTFF